MRLDIGIASANLEALQHIRRLTAKVRELEGEPKRARAALMDSVAENARLREALERIADNHMECLPDCIEGPPTCGCEKRIAQAALADAFLPIGHPTC